MILMMMMMMMMLLAMKLLIHVPMRIGRLAGCAYVHSPPPSKHGPSIQRNTLESLTVAGQQSIYALVARRHNGRELCGSCRGAHAAQCIN